MKGEMCPLNLVSRLRSSHVVANDEVRGALEELLPQTSLAAAWHELRLIEERTGEIGERALERYRWSPRVELVEPAPPRWPIADSDLELAAWLMSPYTVADDEVRVALEIARIAQLSEAEYDFYEQQKMKEQDDRGMLVKAREEGHAEGEKKAHRSNIRQFCDAIGIDCNDERQRHLDALSLEELEKLWGDLLRDRRWP